MLRLASVVSRQRNRIRATKEDTFPFGVSSCNFVSEMEISRIKSDVILNIET